MERCYICNTYLEDPVRTEYGGAASPCSTCEDVISHITYNTEEEPSEEFEDEFETLDEDFDEVGF